MYAPAIEDSTSSRLKEFYRQPARLFWVYGFPTVLALGLGLAFQSRVPESDPGRPGPQRRLRRPIEKVLQAITTRRPGSDAEETPGGSS